MEQWTGGGGGDGEMALTSDPELSSSVPNLIVQDCTYYSSKKNNRIYLV